MVKRICHKRFNKLSHENKQFHYYVTALTAVTNNAEMIAGAIPANTDLGAAVLCKANEAFVFLSF